MDLRVFTVLASKDMQLPGLFGAAEVGGCGNSLVCPCPWKMGAAVGMSLVSK